MTIGRQPAADVIVDPSLVRALLQEQHPDLAHLVSVKIAEGWENALLRLGDELAVRLPRRAASATLIDARRVSRLLVSEAALHERATGAGLRNWLMSAA
jgi:hypothetical protein